MASFFLEIPKGMEVRLLCNTRRQVTPTGRKRHWPPHFTPFLACHSRRESIILLLLSHYCFTMRFAYTYIMTNVSHSVLYTGCTNDLVRRVSEHKKHLYKGSFTDKYNCEYCVYYKEFNSYQSAIDEENRIKGLSRKAKIELIEKKNPEWKELVTEKGFVYDKTPWSEKVRQAVDDLLNDQ